MQGWRDEGRGGTRESRREAKENGVQRRAGEREGLAMWRERERERERERVEMRENLHDFER